MKVYQINVTGRFSTGTIAKCIQEELLREGFGSRFAFGYGGAEDENSVSLCGIWQLRLGNRMQRITGKTGLFAKRVTKKLIRDIEEFEPDIIHLHNLHGNFINVKGLLKFLKVYNKPVILTLHDCWPFTGGCYHFTENGCYKWKSECGDCAFNNGYLLKKIFPIERKSFLQKKKLLSAIGDLTVTAVSDWLNRTASESFLNTREIITVQNGIDTDLYKKKDASGKKKELGLGNKKIVLGVASTWSERKGLSKFQRFSMTLSE